MSVGFGPEGDKNDEYLSNQRWKAQPHLTGRTLGMSAQSMEESWRLGAQAGPRSSEKIAMRVVPHAIALQSVSGLTWTERKPN